MRARANGNRDARVTVFNVASGDDKADEHPELMPGADLVVLIDPSAIKGEGAERWLQWLRSRVVRVTEKASHCFG